MTTIAVRQMHVGDVEAAVRLINAYAAEDRMLERSRDFVLEHVRDFFVAEGRGVLAAWSAAAPSSPSGATFEGCVALAVLTPDLGEVRSLAVPPEASGRGIGRALVAACVDEARRLGLRRLFALTLVPEFFERCGFTLVSLRRLPEKSSAECPVCPKRGRCDEHAMLMHLDGSRPERLRRGEPVGYTALRRAIPESS